MATTMRIAYVTWRPEQFGTGTQDAGDRRRLAALMPLWEKMGIESVPWQPGVKCDLVYVTSLPASLSIAEQLIQQPHPRPALVVGVIEDIGTSRWASLADETIDDLEGLVRARRTWERSLGGRLRAIRDRFAQHGLLSTRPLRLYRVVAAADAVACTSELQAAALRHINPLVVGIADCIPVSDYEERDRTSAEVVLAKKAASGCIALVWEGTAWGLQLLELIREPLHSVAKRSSKPIMLVVVAPRFRPTLLFGSRDNEAILRQRYEFPTLWLDWNLQTVGALLRACDIGLAPMPQRNPFYRAKAFSKPLAYMSVGLPVVASAIPSYCELIEHGKNGWLAHTPAEWTSCLLPLVEDSEKRLTAGNLARKRVEQFHSVDIVADRFRRLFEDALCVRRVRQG